MNMLGIHDAYLFLSHFLSSLYSQYSDSNSLLGFSGSLGHMWSIAWVQAEIRSRACISWWFLPHYGWLVFHVFYYQLSTNSHTCSCMWPWALWFCFTHPYANAICWRSSLCHSNLLLMWSIFILVYVYWGWISSIIYFPWYLKKSYQQQRFCVKSNPISILQYTNGTFLWLVNIRYSIIRLFYLIDYRHILCAIWEMNW